MREIILILLLPLTMATIWSCDDCKPMTTWKKDCNACGCTESGVPVCTTMTCPPAPGNPCKPGSTWNEDCNTCTCMEDGFAACTEMACFPTEKPVCTPGTTFMDACNICMCSKTGRPACTKKLCLPSNEEKPEKPGKCPVSSGQVGICVFDPDVNCLSDSACPGDKKCCSEGCNSICKDPLP